MSTYLKVGKEECQFVICTVIDSINHDKWQADYCINLHPSNDDQEWYHEYSNLLDLKIEPYVLYRSTG